ncbi:hypothetical protein EBR21_15985, partial [bacterium]|nr:hypothetical protein [bacterium]
MGNQQAQRFCGELSERGLFLERVLVLGDGDARDPQPLTAWTSAPADALKLASVLNKASRTEPVAGKYIVYLMTVQRRSSDSAGLAVAGMLSRWLKKPVLIVEAMSGNAPWSSARVHSFVGQGASWNAAHTDGYVFVPQGADPLVDPEKNVSAMIDSTLSPERAFSTALLSEPAQVRNGRIVGQLLEEASAVVCDWASFYIFPDIALRSRRAAAARAPEAPFVLVDDCGLVPLFKYAKVEAAARFIRPKLKPFIATALREKRCIDEMISERLVYQDKLHLDGDLILGDVVGMKNFDALEYGKAISNFAHVSSTVAGSSLHLGGEGPALKRLQQFLKSDVLRYGEERNHPDEACSSRLSPWLHFG